jgi:hypothetical protein
MNRRAFIRNICTVAATRPLLSIAGPVVALLPLRTVLYGDGVHDDTGALQAWFDGGDVVDQAGAPIGRVLRHGRYLLTNTVTITDKFSGDFSYNHLEFTRATDVVAFRATT